MLRIGELWRLTLSELNESLLNSRVSMQPKLFRELTGTTWAKHRVFTKTVPRIILFLKWKLVKRSSDTVISQTNTVHQVLTKVQKDTPQGCPGTSSGKKRKWVSQSSYNFPLKTLLRRLKHSNFCKYLCNWPNNNNVNFSRNINKISKLPKLLVTTLPTFESKSE